jgi:KDO2-lipid IV(A) lauroyltransferase
VSNTWQYYLLKAFSRLVSLLPYGFILFLGDLLGTLYYHIAARQRRRALAQIQAALGLSPEEAQQIIKSSFKKLSKTFLEVMTMPSLTPEKIKRYVKIENPHPLADAVAQGRGVVLLSAHIGNWEWSGAALAMAGFPLTAVIKPQPNDQHTRILNEFRQKAGMEIFSRGTSEMLSAAKALKQGKILALISDQDAGESGIFIEFFGKMASTPLGAAVFAKRFKCPVISSFIVRDPSGGHRLLLSRPVFYQDTGNETEDNYRFSVIITKMIEDTIRQYPDEWLWFQKRWNTKYDESQALNLKMHSEDKAGDEA